MISFLLKKLKKQNLNKNKAVKAIIIKEEGDEYLPYILLGFEKDTNKWKFVGGEVEPNETIKDALFREVLEETGMPLTDGNVDGEPFVYNVNGKEIYVYFIKHNGDLPNPNNDLDQEFKALDWFPIGMIVKGKIDLAFPVNENVCVDTLIKRYKDFLNTREGIQIDELQTDETNKKLSFKEKRELTKQFFELRDKIKATKNFKDKRELTKKFFELRDKILGLKTESEDVQQKINIKKDVNNLMKRAEETAEKFFNEYPEESLRYAKITRDRIKKRLKERFVEREVDEKMIKSYLRNYFFKFYKNYDGNITKKVKQKAIEKLLEELGGNIKTKEKECEFKFDATSDPRKAYPYVAKIVLKNGKIDRQFFDLHREYGRNEIAVFGTYKVKNGDIVEEQTGGSWKNKYRYLYYIDGCKKWLIGGGTDADTKKRVIKFLSGEIGVNELLDKWTIDDYKEWKQKQNETQDNEEKKNELQNRENNDREEQEKDEIIEKTKEILSKDDLTLDDLEFFTPDVLKYLDEKEKEGNPEIRELEELVKQKIKELESQLQKDGIELDELEEKFDSVEGEKLSTLFEKMFAFKKAKSKKNEKEKLKAFQELQKLIETDPDIRDMLEILIEELKTYTDNVDMVAFTGANLFEKIEK